VRNMFPSLDTPGSITVKPGLQVKRLATITDKRMKVALPGFVKNK